MDSELLVIGDRIEFTRNGRVGEGEIVSRLGPNGLHGLIVRDDQGGDWRVAYRSVTRIVRYKLTVAQRQTLLDLKLAGATGETLNKTDLKGSFLRNAFPVRVLRERGFRMSNATLGALARRGLVDPVEVKINETWGQYSTWGLSAEGRRLVDELAADGTAA